MWEWKWDEDGEEGRNGEGGENREGGGVGDEIKEKMMAMEVVGGFGR